MAHGIRPVRSDFTITQPLQSIAILPLHLRFIRLILRINGHRRRRITLSKRRSSSTRSIQFLSSSRIAPLSRALSRCSATTEISPSRPITFASSFQFPRGFARKSACNHAKLHAGKSFRLNGRRVPFPLERSSRAFLPTRIFALCENCDYPIAGLPKIFYEAQKNGCNSFGLCSLDFLGSMSFIRLERCALWDSWMILRWWGSWNAGIFNCVIRVF